MDRLCRSLLALAVGFALVAPATSWAASPEVVLISRIKVKSGQEQAFTDLIRDFYAEVRRSEPGALTNIMYVPTAPPDGETSRDNLALTEGRGFVFYEVYRDAEAARNHPGTPHFAAFMAAAQPLMDGPVELEFVHEVTRR